MNTSYFLVSLLVATAINAIAQNHAPDRAIPTSKWHPAIVEALKTAQPGARKQLEDELAYDKSFRETCAKHEKQLGSMLTEYRKAIADKLPPKSTLSIYHRARHKGFAEPAISKVLFGGSLSAKKTINGFLQYERIKSRAAGRFHHAVLDNTLQLHKYQLSQLSQGERALENAIHTWLRGDRLGLGTQDINAAKLRQEIAELNKRQTNLGLTVTSLARLIKAHEDRMPTPKSGNPSLLPLELQRLQKELADLETQKLELKRLLDHQTDR